MLNSKESLTTQTPTNLKQVDVEPMSPNGALKRSQNRVDTLDDLMDNLSPKTLKTAILGYDKKQVGQLLNSTSTVVDELVMANRELQSELAEYQELAKDGLRTGVNPDTIPPEDQLSREAADLMALTIENEDLRHKISDLQSEVTSSNTRLDEVVADNDRLTAQIEDTKNELLNAVNADAEVDAEQTVDVSALETEISDLKAKLEASEQHRQFIQDTLNMREEELATAKSASENATQLAYSQVGEVLAEAKHEAAERIATAERKANEIRSSAELTAQETRNQANQYYKQRVEEARSEAIAALDEANTVTQNMFQEVSKARQDLLAGHKALTEHVRANQNRLLDAITEQRDLLAGQVDLATSSDMADIIVTANKQLEKAEQVLIGRQKQTLSRLEHSAQRLTLP